MIEDMTMRKLAPKTQASYICAVKKLSDYMVLPPEQTRRYMPQNKVGLVKAVMVTQHEFIRT
jgi:hypothetical protein